MGRVCAEPGCPDIAVDRHCPEHKRRREARDRGRYQRLYDRKRPSPRKQGYTSKWDKARKEFLKQHPYCECGEKATDVDHVKPFRVNGEPDWKLFWDKSNWKAMCHSCHSRKTRRETAKA